MAATRHHPDPCDVIGENLSSTFLESLRNRLRRSNKSQKTYYIYKGPDHYEPLIVYANPPAAITQEGLGTQSKSDNLNSGGESDSNDDDFNDIPENPPSGSHIHDRVLWEDSRIQFIGQVRLLC